MRYGPTCWFGWGDRVDKGDVGYPERCFIFFSEAFLKFEPPKVGVNYSNFDLQFGHGALVARFDFIALSARHYHGWRELPFDDYFWLADLVVVPTQEPLQRFLDGVSNLLLWALPAAIMHLYDVFYLVERHQFKGADVDDAMS